MTVPVLTFFNNKGGVGKTSLVYHLAWMLSDLGHRVLACDLDPQANLTAAFLSEESLEEIWSNGAGAGGQTIMQCIAPLTGVSDIQSPAIVEISSGLALVPGDLALAGFEETLSDEWPNALRSTNLHRPFRVLTAFSTVIQDGAKQTDASIVLVDVGPNLGAINRSAMIATDFIVVPLAADLFSLQGLRNLGPTLEQWRKDWKTRKDHWKQPEFPLPAGGMQPIGYVVQQHIERLDRPVKAYVKWVNRMPKEYARNLLGNKEGPYAKTPAQDKENALATAKHYRSLVPMAQEARKPIFHLRAADGAIGGHASAAISAGHDFKVLAEKIVERVKKEMPNAKFGSAT
ncbi:MAG: AAA family ATPase [Gammaproteobacteria bacterium]|nr:AAA family ATPase [Gammaproteobacteria bacterium]MDD9870416.1 AAA family ATPase [Gammaproteobacteria bacterium]